MLEGRGVMETQTEHEPASTGTRRIVFLGGIMLWAAALCIWSWGSSTGTRALAQAVPIQTSFTNAYWGGWVATESGPFSAVRATWSVPTVPCAAASHADATTYVWIGEGGYLRGLASHLIQAGTASDCLGGAPRYHAFFEWYPGIYATDFPLTVRPGDTVSAKIEQTEMNYWTLTMTDDTTGETSTTATYYAADTGTADFVVERPTLCTAWSCGQVPLARFGQVNFLKAQTWSAPAYAFKAVAHPQPIALHDPSTNRVLALPGRTTTGSGALSVLWRGP
ncbi:MAG: hypothetical protein NVS4B2_00770 [Chloroflexota bacterium]